MVEVPGGDALASRALDSSKTEHRTITGANREKMIHEAENHPGLMVPYQPIRGRAIRLA